jgi:outer membrane receptor for ferrienterochelin and colicin
MRQTKLALFVAATLFTSTAALASDTSSSIRGKVVDASGIPQGNVVVELIHLPTKTTKTLTTSQGGIFTARGLAVGGPYKVRLQDGSEFTASNVDDLFLKLSKTSTVNLVVQPKSQIETITVSGSSVLASSYKQGASSEFGSDQIANTGSIGRDLKSVLARDSKITVDNTVEDGPALSVAGSNIRFNSLTVDGVKQNDDFGLNKNGYPSARSPISLDAIEQLSVNIAPFDVSYGAFQGGNINVVTKSGTNDLAGSVFYYKSNDSLVGDESDGVDINIGKFEEDTWGFSLGGAIVEDKLFFFASYEKYETTSPYGFELNNEDGTLTPTEIEAVTVSQFNEINQIAKDVYDYDNLGFDANNKLDDEKILLKLDWYINDDHRSAFTYQKSTGDRVRDFWPSINANNVASVSNRYRHTDDLSVYSLQFFSDWNEDFSTEFKVGLKEVTTKQVALGEDFSQMQIGLPSGGQVFVGPDQFRHANELDNDRLNFSIKANYYLNDEHNLTFGYEHEILDINNFFVFASKGAIGYNSIEDFRNQNANTLFYQNAPSNKPEDATNKFSYSTNVFYMQDEWTVNDDLTVTAGLRYTNYTNDDKPAYNENFDQRHGYSNTENFDGLSLISPRVGFNYTLSDNTTIRGGFGLFGGGAPNVWLSNSYGDDGVRKVGVFKGAWFTTIPTLDGKTIPQSILDEVKNTQPNGDTNTIDPNFEIPSTWKYNLAIDHTADLSSWGLGDDWRLSAEVIHNDVNNAAVYRELNFKKQGDAPDGRPIYDSIGRFDLSLTNTSKGESTIITLAANKSFYTDNGTFDLSMSYTNQHSKEANPGNAFIAFEGYAQPASSDFQEDKLYNSEYEIPHAFSVNLGWNDELFGDNLTSVNLLFTARNGSHFSYTMGTNNATFGGFSNAGFADWTAFNSQLLYVPTGVDDPLVSYGSADQAQAFDSFVSGSNCLSSQRGQIADRHSCSSPWIQRLDLSITQEVKVTDTQKIELYLDIQNLANLINNDWGRAESYPATYVVPVANATIVGGAYNYDVNVKDGKVAAPQMTIHKIPSVWKAQIGLRYRF